MQAVSVEGRIGMAGKQGLSLQPGCLSGRDAEKTRFPIAKIQPQRTQLIFLRGLLTAEGNERTVKQEQHRDDK